MTTLSPSSPPLKEFLPPDSEALTLEALLHGYGRWWQAQPSLSEYPRQYNTDREHYLIVWEGNPGFYDFYGDFADDNHFYNHVIKGNTIHFHIRIVDRKTTSVEVKIYQRYETIYERYYHTLSDMRAGMLAEWEDVTPDLGEGGEGLRAFTAQNADRTLALLQAHGQEWVNAEPDTQRHFLVYRIDIYLYLCLWVGAPDAVIAGHEVVTFGAPILDWSHLLLYAEIRVGLMRIPVRFDLEQRRWKGTREDAGYYVDLTQSHVATLRNFDALQAKLNEVMKSLQFVSPSN
jgi:hypothetical protein